MDRIDKQEILNKLDLQSFFQSNVEKMGPVRANGETSCLCCFHNEKNPSLCINVHTGLYDCKSCGASGDVFKFYQDIKGCDFKTAIKELAAMAGVNGGNGNGKKLGTEICRYDYTDENGEMLFQAVRYEPKTFRQGHYENGKWVPNLQGVRRVIYNLPDVLKADDILIFEGEKDVDHAVKMGFVATCNPMGAGNWNSEYNQYLEGKKVFIVTDNDEPGQKHASDVAAQLKDTAKEIKIINLPDLGPVLPNHGKDFSDWVHGFNDTSEAAEKLVVLMEEAQHAPDERFLKFPPLTKEQTTFEHFDEPPEPYAIVKVGDRCIVEKPMVGDFTGAGGVGKGFFTMQLGIALAAGKSFGPFKAGNPDGHEVLMICAEDGLDIIKRRLWNISGKTGRLPPKFHIASTVGKMGPILGIVDGEVKKTIWFDWLKETIKNHMPMDLLVLDPKSRLTDLPENDNTAGTIFIRAMEELSQEFNITILFCHHANKAASGKDMDQHMGRGASSVVDGCRWSMGLRTLDKDSAKQYCVGDDFRNYIEVDVTKINYGPKLKRNLLFKRDENGVLSFDNTMEKLREKSVEVFLQAIKDHDSEFSRNDIVKGVSGGGVIAEIMFENGVTVNGKYLGKLIDDMIQKGLLTIVEIQKDGVGRPKNVLKCVSLDELISSLITENT